MKKLLSVLLFAFFSMLTIQANASNSIKQPIAKVKQEKTIRVNPDEQDLFAYWCLTFVEYIFTGYDMEGNALYTIVITKQCVWFPNTPY